MALSQVELTSISVLLPLRLLPPLRLLVPLVLLLRRRQLSPTTVAPAHMLLTSVSQPGEDEDEEDVEDEEDEKVVLLQSVTTTPPPVTEEVAILLGEQPSLSCRRLIKAWVHEQLIREGI